MKVDAMLTEVAGTFVKIAYAADVDIILARGMASRPPARFNRPGEDALYLSREEAGARVALRRYVKPGDPPRVILDFDIAPCALFDLRLPENAGIYEHARQPWQEALDVGQTPETWRAADHAKALGHAGLIDPSRGQPGLWHITLFRWNAPNAPTVRQIGPPRPIAFDI